MSQSKIFLPAKPGQTLLRVFLVIAAGLVAAVLVWQGITASGSPDPTVPHLSVGAAIIDTGVLVLREGLECILVLSAITASMMGANHGYRRPIALGAAIGFGACIVTWFAVVGILSELSTSLPALDVQAATGLLAVIVLVVIMNWFFHKIYWTGWISLHNRRKRTLLSQAAEATVSPSRLMSGLILLGFASVYREGFEVVLFLQSLRLQVGSLIVLLGVLVGLFFTGIVGLLTFVAHRRLPYKKMLVLTGIMLGAVFLVMVGEQAQEMQLAHWIPTTPLAWPIPDWMGLWFSVFPTVETLVAQVIAAVLVIGSYFLARYQTVWRPRRRGETPAHQPEPSPTTPKEQSTANTVQIRS
ncbi:MAG: iron permease [Ktedonobacteraceae bacterium]|nr:iron permease [Ktedonobacteraceae bacterium]